MATGAGDEASVAQAESAATAQTIRTWRIKGAPGLAAKNGQAVLDDCDAAILDAGLERDVPAVLPEVDGDRLAREHRRRKPRLVAGDLVGVVVGDHLQHGAAGDAAARKFGQTAMLPSDLINALVCNYYFLNIRS